MSKFQPSIVRAYELLGWQLTDEKFPSKLSIIHCSLSRSDSSKFSRELAEVLRSCIYECPDDRGVSDLANLLLHHGFDFPDLIPFLSPWDQLMFKWQAEGLTLEKIRAFLMSAGFDHELPTEKYDKFAMWLADPVSALSIRCGNRIDIARILFGCRCVMLTQFNLDDLQPVNECFLQLFNQLWLPEKISAIDQIPSDDFTQMSLHFLFRHQTYQFVLTRSEYGCLDGVMLDELIVNFDAFMAHIGREERVFNLGITMDCNEELGCFVVTEPDSFSRLCQTLYLPASRATTYIKPNIRTSPDFKGVLG